MKISKEEERLASRIKWKTRKRNSDNISRTKSYESYFAVHPEIRWSFLAGMVSRNAGWNMCDLKGEWFSRLLSAKYRKRLFFAYEEANWRIFRDAYPQLLIYHYSLVNKRPLFHLFPLFSITKFMEREWESFWETRDVNRLMTSLIINEQNIIVPVIKKREKVFRSLLFIIQDWLHFSAVLFPTCNGELFGASVSLFRDVDERIELGKRLAELLFREDLFPFFYEFSLRTEPTGARSDYERYRGRHGHASPMLRLVYPVIQHPEPEERSWDSVRKIKRKWFTKPEWKEDPKLTEWYEHKRNQIQLAALLTELTGEKGNREGD